MIAYPALGDKGAFLRIAAWIDLTEIAIVKRKAGEVALASHNLPHNATTGNPALAAESEAARQSAEAERDRLRGEVMRLRNELEDALTAPTIESATVPVQEVRVQGLLSSPKTGEVFDGEVREHVLAVLTEARDAARQSVRDRRAQVLEDVLAANKATGELERRRGELR